MNSPSIKMLDVIKNGRATTDSIAVEEPLEIRLGRLPLTVLMRTPGHDEELAAGLLWTEGIVSRPEQIVDVRHCREVEPEAAGNVITVELSADAPFNADQHRRYLPGTSACGLCGKASIDQIRQRGRPLVDRLTIRRDTLLRLPAAMFAAQTVFARTGGLHAAALFDSDGRLNCVREDVGRHNAVDKVVGWGLAEERLPLSDVVLIVSGRAGFEIVQKAYMAGIPLVASVSAPSSLAVSLARESGLTLAGFVRGDSMNVYAAPQRIVD